MATFEESLALLDNYLDNYTEDELLEELMSYKGCGPKASDYSIEYDIDFNILGNFEENTQLYSLEKKEQSQYVLILSFVITAVIILMSIN